MRPAAPRQFFRSIRILPNKNGRRGVAGKRGPLEGGIRKFGAGIALVDRDGIFAAANPAYQKMLDYTLDGLHGGLLTDVTYPEYREATRKAIAELLACERTYV